MRILVSVLLTLSTVMPAEALENPAIETISVVVRTKTPQSEVSSQIRWGEHAHGWQRAEVPLRGTARQTVDGLSRRLGTTVAPTRMYELLGPESEPLFDEQWGLENNGQFSGTVDADVDAITAWTVSKGAGVIVAVIDSGIDPANEELDARLWVNPAEVPGDGKDNDQNGYRDDVEGWDFFGDGDSDPSPDGLSDHDAHGTLVAGVVAAEVNGFGITGLAPEATIMNLRACDNGFCDSFDVAEAIHYAVDNGADVLNLSFGSAIPELVGDPILEDAMDHALAGGALVVSAAGNMPPEQVADDEIVLPAEYSHANNIAVAASDRDDNLAIFSYYSAQIDIAAPGVEIATTGLDGFYSVDGTSFSAPFVAGLASLLLSTDLSMGYRELADRIKGFADRPAGVGAKVEAGRLNAGTALTHQFIDALGHLFEADIEWAAGAGVTKGCNPPENTLFCPNDEVTRGQMAAFLNRYLDLAPATRDHFIDDDDSIFEDDIDRLAEAGITRGCNPPANDRYCPKSSVNRGQMAAFLVRSFGLTDDGEGDLFVDDDGSTFEHDIDILGTGGITKGCNPPDNDRFCPGQPVTRGAMTAFLRRAPSP